MTAMQITDPAIVDHADAQYALGTLGSYDVALASGERVQNLYRYVKFLDAVTYVNGHVLAHTATPWNVTNDRAGGTANIGGTAAGLATRAHTQNYHGWMQVAGVNENCLGDGSVAAGESVVLHSVDGAADTMAAGEEDHAFGTALTADTGSPTVFTVVLNGLV